MDVSRRSFLGGALAITAAAALPAMPMSFAPVIYGDGIRDDTAGLQALFDGRPFRVIGRGVYAAQTEGHIFLSGGSFKISDTLVIRKVPVTITGANFDGRDIQDGRSVLQVEASHSTFIGNYIEGGASYAHRAAFKIFDTSFIGGIAVPV